MIRGGCLCGGIRFEVPEVPIIVLCHCSMCRKANGGAFESVAAVPIDGFRLLQGGELVQVYESSPGTRRAFCRVCGSRAPYHTPDGKLCLVPAGLFEDDPGVKPSLHMFVGSKAPWWDITDDLPRFDAWVPGYGPDDAP